MPWARTLFKWRSIFWHCLLPQDHTAITTPHCPLPLYMAKWASENSGTNNCSHPGHVQDVWIFSWHWNPTCWPKDLKSYCTTFLRSSFIFHFICGCKCTIGIHCDKNTHTHNNNKHAYFLLFLHFKSERQIFMHPHQKHLPPALGMQFLGYYTQFHLLCFHRGNC